MLIPVGSGDLFALSSSSLARLASKVSSVDFASAAMAIPILSSGYVIESD